MQVRKTDLGYYDFIEDQKSIPLIVSDAERERCLGVDTENSGGLDVLFDNLKLLLFQIEIGGRAYVIDARKVDISPFKNVLESKKHTKVAQNVAYDYKILRVLRGINLNNVYDTMLSEAVMDAGVKGSKHSLEAIAFRYLDIRLDKDTRKEFIDFDYENGEFTENQIKYAAYDVLVLQEIKKRQQIYLNQLGLNSIADLEFELAIPVAKMELSGIKLDVDRWRTTLGEVHRKVFKLSNDLRQVLPDPPEPPQKPIRLKKDGTPYANSAKPKPPPPVLNIDSWQQLSVACKEVGINLEEANKVTRAGLTNNSTLKFAAKMYSRDKFKSGILNTIVEYRGLRQTEKTFGENLIDFVKPDGRIHARFKQLGTNSGRFSSDSPNLQNIQKKGSEGKILRSCFVAEYGHKFVLADYSQIEIRIAAELSSDERMIQILNDPRGDIHRGTAAEMYNVDYELVDGDLRRAAKTINFGLIYGMSVKSLSDRLSCSSEEAVKHLKTYNETYPTLMRWLEKVGVEAVESGYSKTRGGRIRWFPTLDKNEKDYKSKRSFYERVGRNHPIQGCSANMTKLAIVCLDDAIDKYCAKIVNTIHDELCVEVPFADACEVAKLVKRKMIFAGEKFLKKVPILVDVKIRDCWYKDDGVDDNELGQQLWLIKESNGKA